MSSLGSLHNFWFNLHTFENYNMHHQCLVDNLWIVVVCSSDMLNWSEQSNETQWPGHILYPLCTTVVYRIWIQHGDGATLCRHVLFWIYAFRALWMLLLIVLDFSFLFVWIFFILFQIKHHSPPLEDIPELIPSGVRDLIVDGWTVDPDARPTASQLLRHGAFKLLGLSKFSTHPKWLLIYYPCMN